MSSSKTETWHSSKGYRFILVNITCLALISLFTFFIFDKCIIYFVNEVSIYLITQVPATLNIIQLNLTSNNRVTTYLVRDVERKYYKSPLRNCPIQCSCIVDRPTRKYLYRTSTHRLEIPISRTKLIFPLPSLFLNCRSRLELLENSQRNRMATAGGSFAQRIG